MAHCPLDQDSHEYEWLNDYERRSCFAIGIVTRHQSAQENSPWLLLALRKQVEPQSHAWQGHLSFAVINNKQQPCMLSTS
jgi:hypothetical protein